MSAVSSYVMVILCPLLTGVTYRCGQPQFSLSTQHIMSIWCHQKVHPACAHQQILTLCSVICCIAAQLAADVAAAQD
jgi:hypothetical protein